MKKAFSFLVIIANFFFSQVFASDWVLGAVAFSFKQPDARSESSVQAAKVLPQLILEQIASKEVRLIPAGESLDRKLYELQTERLSLFLQLSKEVKSRDSLILQHQNARALKKSIEAAQKTISELESKIDENLQKTQQELKNAEEDLRIEKERTDKISEKNHDDKMRFPFFMPRKEGEKLVYENVVLYNNDASALFEPGEDALRDGYDSWNFEKSVLDSKINGLITGTIISYGEYCSVTAELHVFPGGKNLGTVTEVGTLSDLMALADRIAQNLDSKIANSLPVSVEFSIKPDDAAQKASVIIDGVVFPASGEIKNSENNVVKILESGVHNVMIESPDYETLSVNYSFTNSSHFIFAAEMKEKSFGTVNVRLKKYRDGIFYASGTESREISGESPYAKISVNGRDVLGIFSPINLMSNTDSEKAKNIAFYRIPQSRAFDGAYLLVNAKPYSREVNIDKRRRMMYTAYSALLCSLPALFYCYGNFISEKNSYELLNPRNNYSDVTMWKNRSYIASAVSAGLGAWAFVELIRYLWAADKVLPADAKIDKNAKIILDKIQKTEAGQPPESPPEEPSENNDEKVVQIN